MGPAELFGRAVRYLRKARALRQGDLAARAGISLGRLSAIEHGTYKAWEGSRRLLAEALDFPGPEGPAALLRAVYGNDYPPGDRADPPGEEG
jgi:transcriptional regulator with XRE-family HTH domain